ncbi:MAG TPA: VWA domain-containing protein [Pirellulales bacterium]|nr:VWA domain-containing protein [Pirellulales bacterium]
MLTRCCAPLLLVGLVLLARPAEHAAAQALPGSEVRTSVYGIDAQGQKFVYVFDRSASMGNGANTPLAAAKRELLASLENLGPSQQFQIIFYNEKPTIFAISGLVGRLVFGTERNKAAAREFIEGITAEGGTEHYLALETALRLDGDVIFFLTDADQPGLSAGELERLSQRNQHAIIHAIEFGEGAKPPGENFLAQLAAQNRGQYVYLEVARLVERGK